VITLRRRIIVQFYGGDNVMTLQPIGNVTDHQLRPMDDHHRLDTLDKRMGKRTVIFTPTGHAISDALAAAGHQIRGLANVDAVLRVLAHNPDSFLGIASRSRYDVEKPEVEGFVAFLMLNTEGLNALGQGTLNRSDPNLSHLASQNERPAGIYCWAIYAPGLLSAAAPLIYEQLCTPRYKDASIYGWAATDDGRRICKTLGLTLGAPLIGEFAPHLYYYPRGDESANGHPLYDQYLPTKDIHRATVTVARTFEDMMRVASIRSAVYIAEQNCPYQEEFDGNDFSATHLIGYVGNEPAGCLRLRFFSNFAKVERLAVRHEFRTSRLAFKLARAGVELCRSKGYRRLYGHARKDLVNFWRRIGFKPIPGRPDFAFSDVSYVEIASDIEPHADALSLADTPYRLIRPEGRWHQPGILERSAVRGVRSIDKEQQS